MKSLDNLYAELGLTGGMNKTASASSSEDVLLATLKKLAGGESSDPVGTPKVPTNLGEAAASRDNGTSDPSQVLQAFNSREEKPTTVDSATMNASQNPTMTQGTTSHAMNEVPLQAPAQANSGNTEAMEVIARKVASMLRGQNTPATPDIDLDTVYKVAFINDYLGRTSAQMQFAKMAQEEAMMGAPEMAGAVSEDPTSEIIAMLGQVSADDLVAKKDALLMAIADVLDAEEAPAAMAPEAVAEAEVKEAAAKLLSAIQKNPTLKTKVAAMLGK